jgi:hypothetical protein
MKPSHTFVFPAWKRRMGVTVILLSLLSITFFAYAKFEATQGAHAATEVAFSVINSNPNAVSFEIHNNTLSTSSCILNIGLTTVPKSLSSFGPENEYTVNGWSSATDCTGTMIPGPKFRPGTNVACIVTFTPTDASTPCGNFSFSVTNSNPNLGSVELRGDGSSFSCSEALAFSTILVTGISYTVNGWSSDNCTGNPLGSVTFTPTAKKCTVSFAPPADASYKCE